MSQKKSVDRKTLSEMFLKGADRKMHEHEYFSLKRMDNLGKEKIYHEFVDYVYIDERYYRMAASYYAGEIDELDDRYYDDLVLLTKASELPPKLYADYLRELTPDVRQEEKVTHAALLDLKAAIRAVLEARR